MDKKLLDEIHEETMRRIYEMSKNWDKETFTPIHAYPYVHMNVYLEKVKKQ
jgi:hypothetical protein